MKRRMVMSKIEIPESVKQWKIGTGSANLRSQNTYTNNSGYNLFCQKNGKFLTWDKVPFGINLDFTGDASLKKTHFRLPDGKERDILSGEPVALGIGGGDAYLRYAHRNVGINLEWSKNPVFEWRIFGANGQMGTPIAENSLVAIVNVKVEPSPDFLIYLDRPRGMADVGWTTSPGFWNDFFNTLDKNKVKIAQGAIALL
jgi:hypothetical protein